MEMSDLPEQVQKAIKHLLGGVEIEIHADGCDCKHNEDPTACWVPVAALKPEDITRTISMQSKKREIVGESKVWMAKLEAAKSQYAAVDAEFWEHLYKTYSLPRDGTYEIKDQKTVIMKPKAKSKS